MMKLKFKKVLSTTLASLALAAAIIPSALALGFRSYTVKVGEAVNLTEIDNSIVFRDPRLPRQVIQLYLRESYDQFKEGNFARSRQFISSLLSRSRSARILGDNFRLSILPFSHVEITRLTRNAEAAREFKVFEFQLESGLERLWFTEIVDEVVRNFN